MTVSSDQSSIARTYYESMRDDFEGYAWESDPSNPGSSLINQRKAEQLKAVRQEFDELDPLSGARPSLGQLFKIELDLTSLIPEAALRARYWAIENRLIRVVPKGVVSAYFDRHTVSDVSTFPEEALRQQARSMLDTIHANYQVNFEREVLIRRLMGFVLAMSLVLMAITFFTARDVLPPVTQRAVLLIVIVGMAGATISTMQRLQKATSRDAMVDDGIFELISLRIGWLSILMSVGIGGVSALFIYALVSAGLIDSVVPQIASGPGGTGAPSPPNGADSPLSPTTGCPPTQACPHWADVIYRALGLESRGDLFKLTVYAFVAGFAERFVPDTINKIAKDVIPAAKPPGT